MYNNIPLYPHYYCLYILRTSPLAAINSSAKITGPSCPLPLTQQLSVEVVRHTTCAIRRSDRHKISDFGDLTAIILPGRHITIYAIILHSNFCKKHHIQKHISHIEFYSSHLGSSYKLYHMHSPLNTI